jgi:hypothetical protein
MERKHPSTVLRAIKALCIAIALMAGSNAWAGVDSDDVQEATDLMRSVYNTCKPSLEAKGYAASDVKSICACNAAVTVALAESYAEDGKTTPVGLIKKPSQDMKDEVEIETAACASFAKGL